MPSADGLPARQAGDAPRGSSWDAVRARHRQRLQQGDGGGGGRGGELATPRTDSWAPLRTGERAHAAAADDTEAPAAPPEERAPRRRRKNAWGDEVFE